MLPKLGKWVTRRPELILSFLKLYYRLQQHPFTHRILEGMKQGLLQGLRLFPNSGKLRRIERVLDFNRLNLYASLPYPGKLVVFRVRDQLTEWEQKNWKQLALGGVEFQEASGDHALRA